jgi:glycosyltransferase involved in cell wall biosynthesis
LKKDKKEVLFYFYTRNATFIQKDLGFLRTAYQVYECQFPDPEKWKTPLLFFKQIYFLLSHFSKWKKAVSVCQFAGYHSFIPALWSKSFGRPSIIVAGGTDCVSFPSLRYGHFQNKLLAWFSKQSYQMVTAVSAVHKTLFYRKDSYYISKESEQGILKFMPNARFIQNEIPNGFDVEKFQILKTWNERAPLSFISISASLDDPIRLKLKGIDLLIEFAKRNPHCNFTLVGAENPNGMETPGNVQLIPYVENQKLPALYNQHQFYIQLSISEGFPNALCEAMACGCIPIVSNVASMPEIVNGNGLIVEKRDIEILEKSLSEFLTHDNKDFSNKASDSIASRFPSEIRKNALIQLIDSL